MIIRKHVKSAFLILSLFTTQTVASDFPSPPGDLIDIGSNKLHIICQGEGSPAVILDSGLGGFSLEWLQVIQGISKQNKVCAYDRAGYGWSEAGPPPRASDQISDELYDLLQAADIQPPYVLVGHSFGGFNMQYFAKANPRLTVGMVLVDSSHPDQFNELSDVKIKAERKGSSQLVSFFNPLTILPYFEEEQKQTVERVLMNISTVRTQQREFVNFKYSGELVKQLGKMPDIPLVVVSRGKQAWPDTPRGQALEQSWQAMQKDYLTMVSNSEQISAWKSTHLIHMQEPDLVVQAIKKVIRKIGR